MLSNAGVPSRAIVRAVAGNPVPTLDAMQAALQALPDGARVPIRYVLPHSHHQARLALPNPNPNANPKP